MGFFALILVLKNLLLPLYKNMGKLFIELWKIIIKFNISNSKKWNSLLDKLKVNISNKICDCSLKTFNCKIK